MFNMGVIENDALPDYDQHRCFGGRMSQTIQVMSLLPHAGVWTDGITRSSDQERRHCRQSSAEHESGRERCECKLFKGLCKRVLLSKVTDED